MLVGKPDTQKKQGKKRKESSPKGGEPPVEEVQEKVEDPKLPRTQMFVAKLYDRLRESGSHLDDMAVKRYGSNLKRLINDGLTDEDLHLVLSRLIVRIQTGTAKPPSPQQVWQDIKKERRGDAPRTRAASGGGDILPSVDPSLTREERAARRREGYEHLFVN